MPIPRFMFHRLLVQDIQTLKKRQQRLEQHIVEMKQQIRQLQMNQKNPEFAGVECVAHQKPDSWTFEWVASGLFLFLGIGAIVCARHS
jgi:hypothetical protein